MNFDDIKNELNNPTFKIDIGTLLVNIHSTNLMNSYHLKSILKRQVEILELQKGKTGQELESAVEIEIEELNNQFSEWLKEDLINVVNDCSHD
ncbi:hypothetical protein [Flavobacterium sp. 245]|jgi:hypothetical protein|uniref:hypothetical protein n=1 Tax=Flavobacterium sp. 245 TaxID=2512115 RepID=UPI00105F7B8A|nr:hypothetical protein [Flavobacterium sp. 245]TDP02461.1 hypothetical protein EV145_103451 [Flavobacterium sp. 245]